MYPKNCLNQTYDYWLIPRNQETLCFEAKTCNSGQLQNNTANDAMLTTINCVISSRSTNFNFLLTAAIDYNNAYGWQDIIKIKCLFPGGI